MGGHGGNVDLKIGKTSGASDVATGTANGQNGTTGEQTVKAGTYWFAEAPGANTNLSDYVSTYTCVDTNGKAQNLPTNAAYTGSFSVPVDTGQDIVCTITNARTPQLKVNKVLAPASDPGKFNLTIDGSTAGTGGNVGNDGTTGFVNVTAGQHSVGETAVAGTSLSNYDSTISCSVNGGAPTNGSSITLANAQTGVCTITNNRIATLKLVKDVQNNDGGSKTAADWNLSAAAGAPNDGRNFSSQTASPTFHNVLGGVEYTLSENPNAGTGYSTTGIWSCIGGGTFVSPNKITVPLGGAVTCTIVNTDDTPTLKLVKTVTNNDGGVAEAKDFTLSAVAGAPNDGRDFNSATDTPVFHNVFGGTVYTLSESGLAGYIAGPWSCDGGTQVGATISVPLGGAVTCTINNNDNGPQLKLVKTVTNDNGGTAEAKDFTLSATSTGPNASRDFTSAIEYAGIPRCIRCSRLYAGRAGPCRLLGRRLAVHGRHAGRAASSLSLSAGRRRARSRTTTSRRSCICARSW